MPRMFYFLISQDLGAHQPLDAFPNKYTIPLNYGYNDKHVLKLLCASAVLNPLHRLSPFILPTLLWGSHYYLLDSDEDREAQKSEVNCPRGWGQDSNQGFPCKSSPSRPLPRLHVTPGTLYHLELIARTSLHTGLQHLAESLSKAAVMVV